MRALLLSVLLIGGCCSTDRILLMPDSQGRVGKIAILNSSDGAILDTAYGVAEVSGSGSVRKSSLEAGAAKGEFESLTRTLPPRPVSYTLYFMDDSDQLTAESREQAPVILAEIARRPAAEVVVIGHTDRTGALDYNDGLSLSRAQVIRDQLIALGFDPTRLKFAGRGEREPVVPTADEVAEPRNRRVEINVR